MTRLTYTLDEVSSTQFTAAASAGQSSAMPAARSRTGRQLFCASVLFRRQPAHCSAHTLAQRTAPFAC
jgi:hypothetical protein